MLIKSVTPNWHLVKVKLPNGRGAAFWDFSLDNAKARAKAYLNMQGSK